MSFNEKRRLKRKTPDLVNIAPLIDIVFLLLIFFISTSKISNLKSGLSVRNLPTSKVVEKVKTFDTVLNVYKNKNIKIGNKVIAFNELEKELPKWLKNTRILVINSDKDINVGYLISIIGRAKKIGFKEIQIASTQER